MFRALMPLLFIALLPQSSSAQTRYVMKKFDDGSPYIVWFVIEEGSKKVKVKEEVYWPNGTLDYVGNFQNGIEHGQWTYYYKTGVKKAVEVWNKGKEVGIFYEFKSDGSLLLETHYKNGKVIKEVKH